MERYQRSDLAAGEELVLAISAKLSVFFRGQRSREQPVDDLMQDVWLRIHIARHRYRPGEPLMPWILAIALGVRVDHYRRSQRMAVHVVSIDGIEPAAPDVVTDDEAEARLDALIGALPTSQRRVIKLLKIEGLSLEEVAVRTGSTKGAVKQSAHRAYERLRIILKGPRARQGRR